MNYKQKQDFKTLAYLLIELLIVGLGLGCLNVFAKWEWENHTTNVVVAIISVCVFLLYWFTWCWPQVKEVSKKYRKHSYRKDTEESV